MAARRIVSIGPFQLDLEQRRLSRGSTTVKLGSRALDVLCVLADADGDIVSKDRLLAEVWPGVVVEENNIQVHVAAVRKALENGKNGETYIVTVPGRGYRLTGIERRAESLPDTNIVAERSVVPKTSIAVLPFSNLSGDAGQSYFIEGIVEDIITGLSRIGWFSVIARNSSFVFRDNEGDLRQVGRELDCRYLVQGSVRKADSHIRITARLVEAETGVCVWSERYDRLLDDIFVIQDEIAMSLIGAIEPHLMEVEINRIKRKRPDSLDAYDLVLRAMPFVRSFMPTGVSEAIPLLQKAVELEPSYAVAHAHLAHCFHSRFSRGGLSEANRQLSIAHARAVMSGCDDAAALATAGLVLWFDDNDITTAFDLFDRALAISSSNVIALGSSAFVCAWMGQAEVAIERARRAARLSPFDTSIAYQAISIVEFSAKRYREALDAARSAAETNRPFSVPHILAAVSLVRLGKPDEAKFAAQRVLVLDPTFSMKVWAVTVGKVPAVFGPIADAWLELNPPNG